MTSVKLMSVSASTVHKTGVSCVPGTMRRQPFFLVAAIDRHPGGDTGAGVDAQIELILMQRLAAGARRLEVEHRLYGVGLAPEDVRHPLVEAGVNHPFQADFVKAMRLHHARILRQRIAVYHGVVRFRITFPYRMLFRIDREEVVDVILQPRQDQTGPRAMV